MSRYQITLRQVSDGKIQDIAQSPRQRATEAENDLDDAVARGFEDPEITRDGELISEKQLRQDAEAERTFHVK